MPQKGTVSYGREGSGSIVGAGLGVKYTGISCILLRGTVFEGTRLESFCYGGSSCHFLGDGFITFLIKIKIMRQIINIPKMTIFPKLTIFTSKFSASNSQNRQINIYQQIPTIKKMQGDLPPQEQQSQVFNKIVAYLKSLSIPFDILEHQEVRTSKQAANIRATPLEWGSKTMLVKTKQQQIVMLLYRAHSKVSWNKLRKVEMLGKKCKMCEEADVEKLGVKPGGVPPFPEILGVKGIIDQSFNKVEKMAFNAGLKGKSIVLKTQDFPMKPFMVEIFTEEKGAEDKAQNEETGQNGTKNQS